MINSKIIVEGHTTGNSTAVSFARGAASPIGEKFEAVGGKQAVAMILPSATCDRVAKIQGSVDSGFSSPVDLLAQAAAGRPIVGQVTLYPYMRLSTTTAGSAGDNSAYVIA